MDEQNGNPKCLHTRVAVHMASVEDRDRVRVATGIGLELGLVIW